MCQQNHKRDSTAIQHLKTTVLKRILHLKHIFLKAATDWFNMFFSYNLKARWILGCVFAMPKHQSLFLPIRPPLLERIFSWLNYFYLWLKKKRLFWSDVLVLYRQSLSFQTEISEEAKALRYQRFSLFRLMSWHPTSTASNISLMINEKLGDHADALFWWCFFQHEITKNQSSSKEREERPIN